MSFLKTTAIQHLNASTPAINFDANGRVGIGVSSPSAKLHVDGTIVSNRENSSLEGGQIGFCRSSDNVMQYTIDAYGSGTTPNLRFVDETAAAVRMAIDSSGRVTMPAIPCFGGETASFAGSSSTGGNHRSGINYGNLFSWSNAQYLVNNGNYWNTTSGRFTAPVSGYYQFNTIGHKDVDSTGRTIMTLAVNGLETEMVECYGNYQDVGASVNLYLYANDWVEAGVNNGLRVTRVTFSGFLIG